MSSVGGLRHIAFGFAVAAALLATPSAQAQHAAAQSSQPSAETLSSAANAFDHGTAAFVARRYAEAAQLFETAYHLVPRAPALIQAMRAHNRSGNDTRAATLALLLQARYSAEGSALAAARTILENTRARLVRVDVTCDECTIEVDGSLQETPSFFVLPDVPHRVVGHFHGQASGEVLLQESAGATRTVTLSPTALPQVTPPPHEEPPLQVTPQPTHGGLPPLVFYIAAGATVVTGAITIWSGIDTNAGVSAYEAHPTQEGLDAGQAKEARTNILIATTATLAVGTLVVALFTDFGAHPDEPPPVQVAVAPVPGGAAAVFGATF